MDKKNFAALANAIRKHNAEPFQRAQFSTDQIRTLADYCQRQNREFDRRKWFAYIYNEAGPSGGKRKQKDEPEANDAPTV